MKGHKHFEEETGKTIFKGKVPKFGEAMLTFYAPNKTSYIIPCLTWFLRQPKIVLGEIRAMQFYTMKKYLHIILCFLNCFGQHQKFVSCDTVLWKTVLAEGCHSILNFLSRNT